MASDKAAFSRIYDDGVWSNGSGSGSHPENTESYRSFLQQFMKEKGVSSVVDLGCGDWQSSRLIDWSGVSYRGIDLVENVIQTNKQRYGSVNVHFTCVGSVEEALPAADLLIVKDVLQHWPNSQVAALLPRLSAYRWTLITNTSATYLVTGSERTLIDEKEVNRDIAVGEVRPIDLARSPFGWPVVEVFSHRSIRRQRNKEELKTTVLLDMTT